MLPALGAHPTSCEHPKCIVYLHVRNLPRVSCLDPTLDGLLLLTCNSRRGTFPANWTTSGRHEPEHVPTNPGHACPETTPPDGGARTPVPATGPERVDGRRGCPARCRRLTRGGVRRADCGPTSLPVLHVSRCSSVTRARASGHAAGQRRVTSGNRFFRPRAATPRASNLCPHLAGTTRTLSPSQRCPPECALAD
jgi:hypothetical protein